MTNACKEIVRWCCSSTLISSDRPSSEVFERPTNIVNVNVVDVSVVNMINYTSEMMTRVKALEKKTVLHESP